MTSNHNIRNFVSDSQNFTLRLSEDSFIEDTQDLIANNKKVEQDNVIVISDSSCSSSPKCFEEQKWKSTSASKDKKNTKYQRLYFEETSSGSKEKTPNSQYISKSLDKKYINKSIRQINKAFYISDESTTSSSNESYDRNIRYQMNEFDVKKSYESPLIFTKQKMKAAINIRKECEIYNTKQTNKASPATRSDSSSVLSKLNKVTVCNTPQQDSTGKVKLTKKDTNKILRNIKFTPTIYNFPRERKENNIIIDESIDTDENIGHPAISPIFNREVNCHSPDVIDTSLKNNAVSDSRIYSLEPDKVDMNKYFNTSREEDLYRPLSERKKQQIAEWLMTNARDSQSDSSCSNIPVSTRNSVDSGNNSLERLELNYETPNNRGKINKIHTDEKQTTITSCDKTVQPSSIRQTTLDKFIKKPENNFVFHTPDRSDFLSKTHTDKKISSSLATNTIKNVGIKNCENILDKLYGDSWRNKANVLLPTSEPRKKTIQATNRPIQTERKPVIKKNYAIDSNKPDPVENNVKSRRKIERKYKVQDNSFINDESLSNDSATYHTALTNIRTSASSVATEYKKPMPVSVTIKRILSVCDTDTEDELDDKSSSDSKKGLHKKRLSFSDDESSSTSEFDPGDYVPPKYKPPRKEVTKTPQPSKITPKTKPTTNKFIGHKSFLASLSNTVPLSNAHPDARKYRMDYKNKKEELCKELYKLYNEKVFDNKLPHDTPLEWNVRMRGTAGYCYNKKSVKSLTGVVKSSRIVLATKILDAPDRLRDTLIHEMCHAASWLINDVLDGHGPFWTGWANKAMKTFPELPPIRRCHDYEIKTKFTYRCTDCGYSIGRHSKSLDIEKKRCGHCYGKFELLINKTTKSGTTQVQTPKREPTGFALYVKQNYNSVKKEKNIRHAEVMKILGQQFSAIKITKKNDRAVENDPGICC